MTLREIHDLVHEDTIHVTSYENSSEK